MWKLISGVKTVQVLLEGGLYWSQYGNSFVSFDREGIKSCQNDPQNSLYLMRNMTVYQVKNRKMIIKVT